MRRTTIPAVIIEKARGRFLFADLYMNSLKTKQCVRQITKALKELPEKLDDNYDKIIERIEALSNNDAYLVKRALSWIVETYRPLSALEFEHALAVEAMDKDFDEDGIQPLREVLITAGLVIAEDAGAAVRLVHFTAHD